MFMILIPQEYQHYSEAYHMNKNTDMECLGHYNHCLVSTLVAYILAGQNFKTLSLPPSLTQWFEMICRQYFFNSPALYSSDV